MQRKDLKRRVPTGTKSQSTAHPDEIARFNAEVSEWEHREYFELF